MKVYTTRRIVGSRQAATFSLESKDHRGEILTKTMAVGNIEADVISERIEGTLEAEIGEVALTETETVVKGEASIEEALPARRGRGSRRQTMMAQTLK